MIQQKTIGDALIRLQKCQIESRIIVFRDGKRYSFPVFPHIAQERFDRLCRRAMKHYKEKK